MADTPQTYFAPAEKADRSTLNRQESRLRSESLLGAVLDGFPEPAVILNSNRQILLANDKAERLLERTTTELLGLRLGEALDCLHARDLPAGCGTTEFCRFCGAAQATENCRLRELPDSQECRILRREDSNDPALDLRVFASPLQVEKEKFTLFAIRDIAAEKRRQVLERIFFHDILNAAGGLKGILDIFPELQGAEADEMEELARELAGQLVEEVQAQRDLVAAERGDLAVDFRPCDGFELLSELVRTYRRHPASQGRLLSDPVWIGDRLLQTDAYLLRRVLGNLVKNALEAAPAGSSVGVEFRALPRPTFAVHNEGCMPEAVRHQIFQRSFTTKGGRGRGVGSYSVKLLTERYLKGAVEFESTPEHGTTFRILLPDSA